MADDTTKAAQSNAPADPTPYIRTYAKDVARLTGTQQASAVHGGLFKKTASDTDSGVILSEVDESARQGSSLDPVSPKEFPQETLTVTKDDTISNLNAPTQTNPTVKPWETNSSTMPHAAITNAPQVASREEKRDEILSRLRAKAGKEIPLLVPVPEIPQPIAPASTVLTPTSDIGELFQPKLVSAPVFGAPVQAFPFQAKPAEVPFKDIVPPVPPPVLPPVAAPAPVPRPPAPAVAFPARPLPPPVPSAQPIQSDLHTFKTDFADHIDEKKASTFSVLAAQSDARDARSNIPTGAVLTPKKKSRLPLIVGASFLVMLGIGALGGAYWYVSRMSGTAKPFDIPSLIFADEKVEVTGTGPELSAAIARLAQQPSVNGNVVVTYITNATTSKAGIIKIPQQGGVLIRQIFNGAPDILLRNFDDTSTAGIIDSGDNTAPFFILHVTSYERTFAGMLGWEPTIASDLAVLYPPLPDTSPVSGTTPQLSANTGRFIDNVVANHDVRELKDGSGRTTLMYGYRDKETLIIARNEAAFTAILTRLAAAKGS